MYQLFNVNKNSYISKFQRYTLCRRLRVKPAMTLYSLAPICNRCVRNTNALDCFAPLAMTLSHIAHRISHSLQEIAGQARNDVEANKSHIAHRISQLLPPAPSEGGEKSHIAYRISHISNRTSHIPLFRLLTNSTETLTINVITNNITPSKNNA